jgi:hypothetical protein
MNHITRLQFSACRNDSSADKGSADQIAFDLVESTLRRMAPVRPEWSLFAALLWHKSSSVMSLDQMNFGVLDLELHGNSQRGNAPLPLRLRKESRASRQGGCGVGQSDTPDERIVSLAHHRPLRQRVWCDVSREQPDATRKPASKPILRFW